MIYVVTLPLPRVEASPNTRAHWSKVRKATTGMRNDARLMTIKETSGRKFDPLSTVWLAAIYYLGPGHRGKGYAPKDDDNATTAIKSYRDGIADALGVNDKRFTAKTTQIIRGKDAGQTCVQILIDIDAPDPHDSDPEDA